MNIVINMNEFSLKNIFFNEAIKNTVINDSNFIRILYSNKDFTLNGIYIKVDFIKTSNYNKFFENTTNLTIIKYVENLETHILNIYNKNKQHNYKIHEQISYIATKITSSSSNKSIFSYIFKVSGIWETNSVIGITYKFIDINHQ
tara:strand:- start:7800 stop:8234 length:435 start_codon:yes stop_codon:yes gene_type:complete